jgi:DNA-binding CsgD family transcriptional regulator
VKLPAHRGSAVCAPVTPVAWRRREDAIAGRIAALHAAAAAVLGGDAPGRDAPGRDAPGRDAPGRDAPGCDARGGDAPGGEARGAEARGAEARGGGEPSARVASRLSTGDLTGAVAALAAWCAGALSPGGTGGTAGTGGASGPGGTGGASGPAGLSVTGRPAPVSAAAAAELRDVLSQLRALAAQTAEHDFGLHAQRLSDTSGALRRLSAASSPAQLLDRACEQLVRRCGFGRAVLSRVDMETWRPWMAHFTQNAAASWFPDWIDRAIPLDGLVLETEVLAERRPAAVLDTGESRVYRPIIVDAGRSVSYVVAPVVLDGRVAGFFHADHAPSSRRAGLVDRDVLWTFAQGFSLAYEKLVIAERVRAQRDRLQAALGSAREILSLPAPAPELLLGDAEPAVAVPALSPPDDELLAHRGTAGAGQELTGRELDVLRLLAVGATNAQIADHLVVSESTVKSHVRHILRKLGAVNRAQAISYYLGLASSAATSSAGGSSGGTSSGGGSSGGASSGGTSSGGRFSASPAASVRACAG